MYRFLLLFALCSPLALANEVVYNVYSTVTCDDPEYCFPIDISASYTLPRFGERDPLQFFGNPLSGPMSLGNSDNPGAFTFFTDNHNVFLGGDDQEVGNIDDYRITLNIGIGGEPTFYYSMTCYEETCSPAVLVDRSIVVPEPSTLTLLILALLLVLAAYSSIPGSTASAGTALPGSTLSPPRA